MATAPSRAVGQASLMFFVLNFLLSFSQACKPVTVVTRVVEEGHSVSWTGARGRGQNLSHALRGAAAEDPGPRDHAPFFGGLHVAENDGQISLETRQTLFKTDP